MASIATTICHYRMQKFPYSPSNLQNMDADVGPDRAIVWMRFLIRMHVEQADSPVSFKAALLTEDQQGTCSTYLQVMRQQEGHGLAHQGSGQNVCLHVTQLQGLGTKLQADMDSFIPQLPKNTPVIKIQ